MTDRMARLVAITAAFNKEMDEMGVEYTAVVYDPQVKREDGKLEMYQVQNIPDARADLLLEGFMAIQGDSESHQVEDFVHVRTATGIAPA